MKASHRAIVSLAKYVHTKTLSPLVFLLFLLPRIFLCISTARLRESVGTGSKTTDLWNDLVQ